MSYLIHEENEPSVGFANAVRIMIPVYALIGLVVFLI
jgi:hypothetical protein